MIELKEIQIIINGGEMIHTAKYKGTLHVHKHELDDGVFIEAIEVVHQAIKEIDHGRLGGKRPEKCLICGSLTKEAGRQDLPPYMDWECSLCSMNGYDGRFRAKG